MNKDIQKHCLYLERIYSESTTFFSFRVNDTEDRKALSTEKQIHLLPSLQKHRNFGSFKLN